VAPVRKLKDLEARLGYAFKNRALLKKSLTHASVRQASAKRRDNERLEFLGDRVLGLAVAELLSETYPAATEGQLAPSTGWCEEGLARRSPARWISARTCI
jgi:ribonuclease-3